MTATPAAEPAGREPEWVVVTASAKGASHAATGAPNQDAVAAERAGTAGVVAAVADGHGHSRHLRSGRGSRIAVLVGCQVAQELAGRIERDGLLSASADAAQTAGQLQSLVEEFCVPAVIERWHDAVLADVRADPFTEAEQAHRHAGDDPVIAYGSTLLLGLTLGDWLLLAQIGDGDVVGVLAGGACILPVPADPQLDGLVTTSLCGSDPRRDFRVAVVSTRRKPLLAVLLATDGYGNAQVVEDWPAAFSADLAWMLRDRDVNWLAAQLPSWAARCASPDGSADDTTVALMVSPTAARLRPGMPAARGADDGSEETTIPAVRHADTVPAQVPESLEPVTMRQLAHRQAPEPVIVEPAEPAAQHEPPTNEIPKLGRHAGAGGSEGGAGAGGSDGADAGGSDAGGSDAGGSDAGGSGAGGSGAGGSDGADAGGADAGGAGAGGSGGHEGRSGREPAGAEPPTTRWRLPGRGER